MASGYVQVPPDSTGKKVDCTSISSGAVRQVIVVGDPTVSSGFATVTGGKLNVNASVGSLPNVTIGSMPNVTVSGGVAVSGNVTVDKISAAVVLAAGTANIGTINAISATVNVAGSFSISGTIDKISAPVVLAAGAAHIGEVNISLMPAVNISSMPNVTIGSLPNINVSAMPAVSLASGATLDGISKTVNVAITNAINISSMPAISIGPISTIDKISQTVLVAITSAINFNISSMPSITVSVGPITTIDKISATVIVAGVVTMPTSLVAANGNTATVIGKICVVTDTNDFLYVSGPKGPGVAASGYFPVQVGGIDGGGLARQLKMDTSGNIQVGVVSTVTVAGVVTLGAGAANIGTINNISATVNVAGTFTIGTIDKISATVTVAGTVGISGTVPVSGTIDKISAGVVLAAGSANIGTIDGISKTVAVSIASTLGVTGTVALAAGSANIGTIDGISKTVNVSVTNAVPISGTIVLAAGANNIGSINGISQTVVVVNSYPRAVSSASHGPKTVTLSSSAGVALIAAPGAALSIYVTQLLVTNGSASLTRVDLYEASASASPVVAQYAAANGGGFTVTFDPPYKVSANTQLTARLKPSVSQVLVTPNFYVGS